MIINNTLVLLCTCEGSLPIQTRKLANALGTTESNIPNQLCRAHSGIYEKALKDNKSLLVACTQEAPMFEEIRISSKSQASVSYVNIRETAGWGHEGKKASAKIAALLAEACLDSPNVKTVSMVSEGRTLVYGNSQIAFDVAQQLAERLDVTLILDCKTRIAPHAETSFAVLGGNIQRVQGHLGSFDIALQGLVAVSPSSREVIKFENRGKDASLSFDIFVDVSGGAPFIQSAGKRDGYFHLDPKGSALISQAMLEISDLAGEFEKPRYVEFDKTLCAHTRNQIPGCSKCVDLCETSAIQSAGETVAVDPYICAGCGDCSGICPTGAISYTMPGADHYLNRLRVLLSTYAEAGGKHATIVVHDVDMGAECIRQIGRSDQGLPSEAIPFPVNRVTQIGVDFLLASAAYGATAVKLLAPRSAYGDMMGLNEQVSLANVILSQLGFSKIEASLINEDDPERISPALFPSTAKPINNAAPFVLSGTRRDRSMRVLRHLHEQATGSIAHIELPQGAPFGAVVIDADNCTLCLSCVGGCPTGALSDNKDKPLLKFTEEKCIQCGLCKRICPEKVIQLSPGLNLTPEASTALVLKQEEPFLCVSCNKPFATRGVIKKMMNQLAEHSMFKGTNRIERLKMCDECRVVAEAEDENSPLAIGARPKVRTTDDYLQ